MLGQVEEKGSAMRGSFFISLSPVRNLWFSTKKLLLSLAWQVCSDSPWTILGGYQRGWPRSRYLKYLELITPSHKYHQFQIYPRAFLNWQRKVLPTICGDYPRYRHPFKCQTFQRLEQTLSLALSQCAISMKISVTAFSLHSNVSKYNVCICDFTYFTVQVRRYLPPI